MVYRKVVSAHQERYWSKDFPRRYDLFSLFVWGKLCIFAWVLSLLGRYFRYFYEENYHVYCLMLTCAFWFAKHSSIVYVIGKSNSICTISNFLLYTHYIETPTHKGANSCKLKYSKMGNWQTVRSVVTSKY